MTNEELAERGKQVILEVMRANEASHEPGEWERQSVAEHLRHAAVHGWDAMDHHDGLAVFMPNTRREDLRSAFVRSLMALVVYEGEGR